MRQNPQYQHPLVQGPESRSQVGPVRCSRQALRQKEDDQHGQVRSSLWLGSGLNSRLRCHSHSWAWDWGRLRRSHELYLWWYGVSLCWGHTPRWSRAIPRVPSTVSPGELGNTRGPRDLIIRHPGICLVGNPSAQSLNPSLARLRLNQHHACEFNRQKFWNPASLLLFLLFWKRSQNGSRFWKPKRLTKGFQNSWKQVLEVHQAVDKGQLQNICRYITWHISQPLTLGALIVFLNLCLLVRTWIP